MAVDYDRAIEGNEVDEDTNSKAKRTSVVFVFVQITAEKLR